MTDSIDRRVMLGAAGLLGAAALSRVASAGPLNPPAGPITSTGKTLTEVEPRTAINAANTRGDANSTFRITQPGSYYLVGNLAGENAKHGIEVAASGVTIDLNGFALLGVPGSLSAIATDGPRSDIAIRNGSISGWGGAGINLTAGGTCPNSIIEHIIARSNGDAGIQTGARAAVRRCIADLNGGDGITCGQDSSIADCTAVTNTGNGIRALSGSVIDTCVATGNTMTGILTGVGCTIAGCAARSNGDGGIFTSQCCALSACSATSNTGGGIIVTIGCSVVHCTAQLNTGDGISASDDCTIRACTCDGNGGTTGAGIRATGSDNLIEGNNCTDNGRGIVGGGTGNFIARNVCSGNTTNWEITANNICLVVQAAPSGAFSGNSGGVSPGSTDPNANFTY